MAGCYTETRIIVVLKGSGEYEGGNRPDSSGGSDYRRIVYSVSGGSDDGPGCF